MQMGTPTVILAPLELDDREQFILDNQEAFLYGAAQEFGMREAIPAAQERISWSMPTFWDGKNVIQFAASKHHIGLYPGSEAVEVFLDRLSECETSKGTIRLPYQEPLPLDLVADIAEWCWNQYKV